MSRLGTVLGEALQAAALLAIFFGASVVRLSCETDPVPAVQP